MDQFLKEQFDDLRGRLSLGETAATDRHIELVQRMTAIETGQKNSDIRLEKTEATCLANSQYINSQKTALTFLGKTALGAASLGAAAKAALTWIIPHADKAAK